MDLRTLNKRVVESLIKCGAMDGFGDRGQLLKSLDQTRDAAQQEQKAEQAGQFTMFDAMFTAPPTPTHAAAPVVLSGPATPQREMLAWEKDVLGLYISSHPFQQAADKIGHAAD